MNKTLSAVVLALALVAGVTQSAHASTDGTPSTGSITVATNANLAAASASGSVTILSTTGLTGTKVSIGPYVFVAGRDFVVGASTMAAANSLEAAINASKAPVTAAYATGDTTIALTAIDVGTSYNSVALLTSDDAKVSVSGAALTGGLNNASLSINAITLTQGTDFFKLDVASNTAINLAAAINQNPKTNILVNAVWTGGTTGVVMLRSVTAPGAAYSLAVGGSGLTKSQANMSGLGSGSSGSVIPFTCYLGAVDALPTTGYPAGCLLFLRSDPTKLYLSTQAVTGAATANANSWLAR